MRYLVVILFLASCTATEIEEVDKYDTLLLKVQESQLAMDSSIIEATEKEAIIINKTVESIIEDKKQIKELFSEVAEIKAVQKIKPDTIRDTVFIKEKKSFFGKTKIDTL
jgi:hypothetical protein